MIADCGGTSTSWAAIGPDAPRTTVITAGYNAASAPEGALAESLTTLPTLAGAVSEVRFYGAGCANADICRRVANELKSVFHDAEIHVASDMLGAARALCGRSKGIVAIIGTGSNSCLYDGENIIANTPPLGYILGDEAGGAVIGKNFLCHFFKGLFDSDIANDFKAEYPSLTTASLIERVYRQPGANTWLASFMPFISRHKDHPQVSALLEEEFSRFLSHNIMPYHPAPGTPVHFVGSVAYHLRDIIAKALQNSYLSLGTILQSPLDALVRYHSATKR